MYSITKILERLETGRPTFVPVGEWRFRDIVRQMCKHNCRPLVNEDLRPRMRIIYVWFRSLIDQETVIYPYILVSRRTAWVTFVATNLSALFDLITFRRPSKHFMAWAKRCPSWKIKSLSTGDMRIRLETELLNAATYASVDQFLEETENDLEPFVYMITPVS